MELIAYLSSIINVSKELEKELALNLVDTSCPRSSNLLSINARCNKLYYIKKGIVRGYYISDGKEITTWFAQEGEFATCFYSFITGSPSFENIQVLEDSEFIEIPFSVLQKLYKDFPETERIGRIITENYYIKLEERVLSLQFKTAKERYQRILETKPSLLQRASLGQIASYLGISQETLSRIRAEI